MEKEFDLLVFIGRFQPFHAGHARVIETAIEKAKRVLILVGSAGKARTIRNPFTFEERRAVILESMQAVDPTLESLIVEPLNDVLYNDSAWIKQIQTIVNAKALEAVNNGGFASSGLADAKIGLIGASKDHTSYYLNLFPQWKGEDVSLVNQIHATNIREKFLMEGLQPWLYPETLLPKASLEFLGEFMMTKAYNQLNEEILFVKDYQKSWEAAPYPVKHLTVDAVVEQSGHVLLVRRRAAPGKGLWALPGGHLEMDETMVDGMIRELREETKIKVPDPVIRGSIVSQHTFDEPNRSTIGRVVTQAFHVKLRDVRPLPKIKGSDDAEKAMWVPIADIKEDMLFDDHYHIIQYFLGGQ